MGDKATVEQARAQRSAQADAMRSLSDGSKSAAEALSEPPTALLSADVYDVLMRCASLGRESVRRTLERAGVWPHTRLGELSPEQRQAIVAALPPRARP